MRRREFLTTACGTTAAAIVPGFNQAVAARSNRRRPRVAAVFTVLRFRSHAFNILENFLKPYYFNGVLTDPGVNVVALYADQFPEDDMARDVAKRFGIPLYASIAEALCQGADSLDVDAVLSIGEHGNYPWNEWGQHLYPRKRFFDEALQVMHQAGRYVPFFNDKHLSYRWDWAREMYDAARQYAMPLIAGSSVPLAQRRPALDLPSGAKIEEAVSIHGGGLESYDFHAFEVLQSFVESRAGGETGIAEVQLLTGEDFLAAQQAGRWSQDLVDAAMAAETDMQAKRQPRATSGVFSSPKQSPSAPEQSTEYLPPEGPKGDYAISVRYVDGLRATVLKIGSSSDRWNFACRLSNNPQPHATALFNGPWGNRCLFKALSHAIQHTFVTGQEPYPAERTLLTTAAVDAVMQSWKQGGSPITLPHGRIRYQAQDVAAFRETGASWSKITSDVAQPMLIER